MIHRTLQNILKKNITPVTYLFSASHEPAPTRLPKVSEVAINIYVKNNDGVVQKCVAFVGESLLQAITRNKVRAYSDQLCHGFDQTYRPHYRPHDNDSVGPQCAQCRVVLEDNWFQRVHNETDGFNNQQEQILNLNTYDTKKNTRLACCVPIQKWMQGLTCSVDVINTEGGTTILL